MRLGQLLSGALLVSLSTSSFAYTHSRRAVSTQHSYSRKSTHSAARTVGQRTIDDSRASEIQAALTHAGYLSGEPTGHWDSSTESAMQRFQADNGWQTKLIPDSRAIIKLGLGPHLESASALAPQ